MAAVYIAHVMLIWQLWKSLLFKNTDGLEIRGEIKEATELTDGTVEEMYCSELACVDGELLCVYYKRCR